MTTTNLARRVQALELRSQPAARWLACTCGVPGGSHTADCPAATAGDNDTVILVLWEEHDPALLPGKVIHLRWDDDDD